MVGLTKRGGNNMKYGYNLFSAWEITKDRDSLISVMRALKGMGYDGVEFFLYFDIPAGEMRQIVDEIGIKPFSTHPRLIRFFENLDEEIAYAKAVGMETLVMPHVLDEEWNPGYYQKLLEAIPGWKEKCDKAGLRLAWHNHEFEFRPYGDRRYLMDALLDAAPVEYEIDTFWTTYAGVDTLALMEQYRDRIKYVHFKDYKGTKAQAGTDAGAGSIVDIKAVTGTDIDFCAVGEGLVDVQAVAGKARELGVEWAIVEQDLHRRDILEDARTSLKTLKKLFEG